MEEVFYLFKIFVLFDMFIANETVKSYQRNNENDLNIQHAQFNQTLKYILWNM